MIGYDAVAFRGRSLRAFPEIFTEHGPDEITGPTGNVGRGEVDDGQTALDKLSENHGGSEGALPIHLNSPSSSV